MLPGANGNQLSFGACDIKQLLKTQNKKYIKAH